MLAVCALVWLFYLVLGLETDPDWLPNRFSVRDCLDIDRIIFSCIVFIK